MRFASGTPPFMPICGYILTRVHSEMGNTEVQEADLGPGLETLGTWNVNVQSEIEVT